MVKIKLAGQEVKLPDNAIIARPPAAPGPITFPEAIKEALDNPLDTEPLEKWDLREKKLPCWWMTGEGPRPAGNFCQMY